MNPAPPTDAWLEQARDHLQAKSWLTLLDHSGRAPPTKQGIAALLATVAHAYLGQSDQLAVQAESACKDGISRQLVIQGLMAAAHSHVCMALCMLRTHDKVATAFHSQRESLGLRRVTAGTYQPTQELDEVESPQATLVRQRRLVVDLRRRLNALRASSSVETRLQALVASVRENNLTYLSSAKLTSLARTCQAIEEQCVPGSFVEAGCALGGSAVVIGSLKRPRRRFEVYDVFGMIPPPGDNDPTEVHHRYDQIVSGSSQGIGGDPYYGYTKDLLSVVRRNLELFGIDPETQNVELVPGLVQNTLVGTGPVAFAHVDVDWYEASMTCLERLYPRLSVGGSIIVDDYHDWQGCRRAVDEFLTRVRTGFVTDDSAKSLKITKIDVIGG